MLDKVNSTVNDLAANVAPVRQILTSMNWNIVGDDKFNQAHEWFAASLAGANILQVVQNLYLRLTWSTVLVTICVLLVAANFKNFPLVYHLRILNGVRFVLKSQRPPEPIGPEQLFKPLITSSRATLMETDVFGHKSNSTYFSDIDVARTHFITTLFSQAIEKLRGSTTMNGLSGKKSSGFTVPLGGVSCSFRRELKPYEKYDMWTRILSWDEKWVYLVTHFVKAGAKVEPQEYSLYPPQNSITASSSKTSRQSSIASLNSPRGSISGQASADIPSSAIAASAMSKIVFKNGRITIAPEVMLEAAGLLPAKPTSHHSEDLKQAQVIANVTDVGPKEAVSQVEKVEGSDNDSESSNDTSSAQERNHVREMIEVERQRGMKLARLLREQTGLEHEFNDQVALGRHYDGHGIEGVVATLAQLGKLSNYQLL